VQCLETFEFSRDVGRFQQLKLLVRQVKNGLYHPLAHLTADLMAGSLKMWGLLVKMLCTSLYNIAECVRVASIILVILIHMHCCMNTRLNLSPKAGEYLSASVEEL